MKELKEVYPTHEFYFIMGSDLVKSYQSWDYGDKLKEDIKFIILNRPGYEIDKDLLPKHNFILYTNFEGSSTQIRNRLNEYYERTNKINLGINGLTTTRVIRYIVENNLYSD
jgi:nicotinate-nucleotide adenylyltransferase